MFVSTNTATRRWITILASAAGLAVVVTSVAIIMDDPDIPVEAQVVDGVTSASSITTSTTSAVSQSVDGLERLQGVLLPSDEADEWLLAGLEIDIGPVAWMRQTIAESDIDGNGAAESIYEELRGVSGTDIEIWVRFDNTRDDAELFAIEQTFIRDPTAQEPPWAGTSYDDGRQ